MEAAAHALEYNPRPVPDDAVITVIVNGKNPKTWDGPDHNAKQPTYRHTAGAVRLWVKRREWEHIIALFERAGVRIA